MGSDIAPSYSQQGFDINALLEISRNNAISTSNLIQKVGNHDQMLAEISTAVGKLTDRMDMREQSEFVTPNQKKMIKKAVGKQVYKLLGIRKRNGRVDPDSKRTRNVYGGLFFSKIYTDLNGRFDASTYEEIKAAKFDDAMAFIRSWPNDNIDDIKREAEENWNLAHPETTVDEYLGTWRA